MDEVLIPFLIESVLLTIAALILQGLSIKQVAHDILNHERLRPLIISHYLTCVANVLFWICSLDSQSGLGLFSFAGVEFLNNSKSYILIASAKAVSVSFIESYQLVTQGPQTTTWGVTQLIGHSFTLVFGCSVFAALAFTRDPWLAVVSHSLLAFYSILVALQVFYSTLKVRKILVEEYKRTSKYAEGIRKLTRLLVLVAVVAILGNIGIFTVLAFDIKIAQEHDVIPEVEPRFETWHIFNDVTSVLAPAMLLMGAWVSRSSSKKDTVRRIEANTKDQPRPSNIGSSASTSPDSPDESHPEVELVVNSTSVTH